MEFGVPYFKLLFTDDIGSKRFHRVLANEPLQLAEKVLRIEAIRSYVGMDSSFSFFFSLYSVNLLFWWFPALWPICVYILLVSVKGLPLICFVDGSVLMANRYIGGYNYKIFFGFVIDLFRCPRI